MPPSSKPWYRSLTVWALLVTAFGATLTQLGAGGLPAVLGDPGTVELVGQALMALGFPAAAWGRFRADCPISRGRNRGAGLGTLSWLAAGGGALLGALGFLTAAGCGSAERCPSGEGVVATFQRSAPSSFSARCSGDEPATERRRLEGDSDGTLEAMCPAGEAPGPRESTIEEVTCPLGTCTLSEITCTPYGPPGDNASSGAGHLGGGGP